MEWVVRRRGVVVVVVVVRGGLSGVGVIGSAQSQLRVEGLEGAVPVLIVAELA